MRGPAQIIEQALAGAPSLDDAMDCCFAPPATLSCVLSGCGATDVLVQIDLNGLHDAVVADGHTASNAPDLF